MPHSHIKLLVEENTIMVNKAQDNYLWDNMTEVVELTAATSYAKAGDSSYSAASKSVRCAPLKSLGITYCLTGTNNMIMSGNRTPAIGIHVIPKHISK